MITQQRLGLQQGLNAAGILPGMGQQNRGTKTLGQLRQAQAKKQSLTEGTSCFQQGHPLSRSQQLLELQASLLRWHRRPGTQLAQGRSRGNGLKRRQQGAKG